jgi:hypothetical protein
LSLSGVEVAGQDRGQPRVVLLHELHNVRRLLRANVVVGAEGVEVGVVEIELLAVTQIDPREEANATVGQIERLFLHHREASQHGDTFARERQEWLGRRHEQRLVAEGIIAVVDEFQKRVELHEWLGNLLKPHQIGRKLRHAVRDERKPVLPPVFLVAQVQGCQTEGHLRRALLRVVAAASQGDAECDGQSIGGRTFGVRGG